MGKVNDGYLGHFWVVEWCWQGEQRGNFHVAPFVETLTTNMQIFAGIRPAKFNDRWIIVAIAYTSEQAHTIADGLREVQTTHGLHQHATESIAPSPVLNDAEMQRLRKMPYKDYLTTDYWRRVRNEVLRRAEYRCQLCNAEGELHIHHRSYENRGQERFGDVIALCAQCHAKFHGKED